MLNKQASNIFDGIFGHFLARNSIIQVGCGLILIALLLPFFDHLVQELKHEQGATLTNATLAATQNNLLTNNLGAVAQYGMQILKHTPNTRYLIFSKKTGEETIISAHNWHLNQKSLPYSTLQFDLDHNAGILQDDQGLAPTQLELKQASDTFTYSSPILINGQQWGVITIGFEQHHYTNILQKIYWAIAMCVALSCLIGAMLFFAVSKRIRREISAFGRTATLLSYGELSARAPEGGIGEIGALGKAINAMSSSLESQSARSFQLAQIVEQTNDAFILFDRSFNVIFANDALNEITGFDATDFEDANIHTFTRTLAINLAEIETGLKEMQLNLENNFTKDMLLTRKDGMQINVEMRLESIEDIENNTQSYLLVFANITSRKDMEQELHQLAFYDKLTGLPNRRMFMDSLQKSIKQSERQNTCFALFFMDLDNFKNINDSMGHEAGDELLIQIAQKLKEIFRGVDLVTRLGGDEFTVIIEYVKSPGHIDLGNLAAKAVKQLSSQPVLLNGRPHTISTSLGIAKYPENGLDSDTLVKNADTAMYAAKKSGKNNYAFYTDSMNVALQKYLEIENDLKEAIKTTDQLRLQYQPIVSLSTKEMVAVEVLARWEHPTKGEISPSEFIGVAEKTDLILVLSERLLQQAFTQAKEWQSRGLNHYVSVNISVRQFDKENFIQILTALIIDYDINPSKIQLEFTEGIMLDSTEETIKKFEKIKELGFRIAIDDFGTGYSSLSYIHKLPIDVIKIDRAFVSDILNNEKSQAILTAITTLSKALNIETVAEGIEFTTHEKLVMSCLCDYGQGYLYDASMLIGQFEEKYMNDIPPLMLANQP